MSGYLNVVDHRGNLIPSAALDYEAADTGRRMSFWGLSGSGPNASISGASASLRYRSRTLRRNNPLVSGGIDSLVANMVGTDISPRWDLEDNAQKEEIQDVWSFSLEEMDYYGVANFYGLQEQTAAAMITDGECLGRMVTRDPEDSGLLVPFQVQLLEADHLDLTYNDFYKNGNEIRHSIEWQKGGGRSAYHIWSEHPGENFLTSTNRIRQRIPAADMVHVFRPLRPGQQRGSTFLSSLITKLHEIDQYDDAEVVRKKAAAMWGGFFVQKNTAMPNGLPGAQAQQGTTVAGPKNLAMEPGTYRRLPVGWEVQFSEPADVGANYEIFMKTQFRMVARGLGITYEQLTGDLTDVNFSSIRAGLIEFRRLCEMVRERTLVSQFCRPIVNRWFHTAVLAGVFKTVSLADYLANPRKYQRITFMPDAWDYTSPVDDRIAEQMDIRNGLDSRGAIVGRRGMDVEKLDKEIAEDNARTDRLGIVLDSDPRHTAKSGKIQSAEKNAVGRE